MKWPCCLPDSLKNRIVAKQLIEDEKRRSGEVYSLVIINKQLQARKPEYLEKHKDVLKYTLVE